MMEIIFKVFMSTLVGLAALGVITLAIYMIKNREDFADVVFAILLMIAAVFICGSMFFLWNTNIRGF